MTSAVDRLHDHPPLATASCTVRFPQYCKSFPTTGICKFGANPLDTCVARGGVVATGWASTLSTKCGLQR